MSAKRTVCFVCFLTAISNWFGLLVFLQHILPSEKLDRLPSSANILTRHRKNTQNSAVWSSNLCLDFEGITSSIANSADIHFDLSECTVCEKKGNGEYYIKNDSVITTIDTGSQLQTENASFLMSCSDTFDHSFEMENPIGIPAMIDMPSFVNDSFKHWCFTHSPGLQLDNTLVTEKYLFRMNYHRYGYGTFPLLNGKKIKNIYPINSDKSVRNMVFIASFFGAVAFQHFIPGVIPRMAMIYDLILNQYKCETKVLNITIITHLDIRTNTTSIQNWFWDRFETFFRDNYEKRIMIHLIDVIDHLGWLAKTEYTYWSDMFIVPHLMLRNHKTIDYVLYPRGLLQPLEHIIAIPETKEVKPFLILYYSRGDATTMQRSIQNNKEVMATIKIWVDNTLNAIQNEIKFEFKVFKHKYAASDGINQDAIKASLAMLHIGAHGGALANLLFAKKETFLLEFNDWSLKHEQKVRTWFYALAQMKNMHYFYLCPDNFTYEVHQTLQMHINITDLKKALLLVQQQMIDNKVFAVSNVSAHQIFAAENMNNSSRVDTNRNAVVLSVNETYLEHMKHLPRIPKLIHVIWPDKDILNSSFNMIEHGLKRLYSQNPEWRIMVHDDQDMVSMFNSTTLLSAEEKQELKHAHIVEQTDAFRLLLMYEEGGLYIDIDRAVNVPLDTVIAEHTRLVIPTHYNVNFAQDLFGSSPYNKVILEAIRLQWEIRMTGYNGTPLPRKQGWVSYANIMRMGNSFSGAIEQALFGRRVSGEMDWNAARKAIEQTKDVIVTKKDMWCDGLVVRPYDGCKKIERASLYATYNVTPWGGEVKALWAEK